MTYAASIYARLCASKRWLKVTFNLARATALMLLLLPAAVAAQPIHLKLAFYESDDTAVYLYGIKPFVDGVNAEGKGQIAIDVYTDGKLGAALAEQPQIVLSGAADITFIIPGQTAYRFPDNTLLELPGLFHDLREATLTYTRLVATDALRGYQNFHVIGAYTTRPNTIHSRKPIDSLSALRGQKIRANNPTEAALLGRLGAIPTVLPVPKVADALEHGAIDGAALAPTALLDYHIVAQAPYHYLLRSGVNPFALVMNMQKFASLPESAKALIRKYGGNRAAETWIEAYGRNEQQIFDKIRSDRRNKIVAPSPADLEVAHRTFRSVIEAWVAQRPQNAELLRMANAELAKIRSAK